jgi:hypothetical protein
MTSRGSKIALEKRSWDPGGRLSYRMRPGVTAEKQELEERGMQRGRQGGKEFLVETIWRLFSREED